MRKKLKAIKEFIVWIDDMETLPFPSIALITAFIALACGILFILDILNLFQAIICFIVVMGFWCECLIFLSKKNILHRVPIQKGYILFAKSDSPKRKCYPPYIDTERKSRRICTSDEERKWRKKSIQNYIKEFRMAEEDQDFIANHACACEECN